MDNQNDIAQYINDLSSNMGRIADSINLKLGDSVSSANSLNSTLAITNILLACLVVIALINLIIRWKRGTKRR